MQLPVLRQGDTGPTVRAVQRLLIWPGVDGQFGPVTRAAVVRFQTTNRLTPDGIVGVHTWGALLGAPQ